MAIITVAVEGFVDSVVARKICEHLGHDVGPVHVKNGKNNLDPRLQAYNHAATRAPWLVLRDLDSDAPCAALLCQRLLPEPTQGMHLRVPVRSIESWLLADPIGVAQYLGVSARLVPPSPDSLDFPKRTLVELARRCRNRLIREDMVPEEEAGTSVGPGYSQRVTEFVTRLWNPDRAAENSDSLHRCMRALSSRT